jgi:plasmid stabilization system protein ParE
MAKINWTVESDQWLKDIHDYIFKDNPNSALRVVEAIYNKAQLLLEFPEIGYTHKHNPDLHIRILLYGHYRIAYLIKPNRDIDILGVFHGALDIDRYL